ncbi:N-6 DNA methylase [Streptacidiphilus griseoplanus]|uniref:N-6 DNA methylase n=1 Tax=Peterkaempfera griseoplana TaxID=66896 RepID=UPI0006E15534|nr:N-6 DNA methylase [Peterkaempfera griseoplana]
MSERVTVTAAEVARLAGVGRAAVSNWRRRHEDFPAPAGGTDASPLFALAEVEEWLRSQGKLTAANQRDWLWPHFDALGDRDRMGQTVAAVGARCLQLTAEGATHLSPPDLPAVPDPALVDRAVEVARAEGPYETFEFLRGRWLDTHVRQISATPAELAELMTALALPEKPGDAPPDVLTVLDPACGTGTLLSTALHRGAGRPGGDAPRRPVALLGQESDPTCAALAAVRLAFEHRALADSGPAPAIRVGDTLRQDAFPDVRADAVVCNPPFNERDWGHDELSWDDRWAYGLPPRTESEIAWVQHALARLRPGGTAVLLMPPAAASRRAGRRIRSALLQRGALRAVVALPPGAAPPHGVALHLWVLRSPGTAPAPDSLLLVDAAGAQAAAHPAAPADGRTGPDWPTVHRAVLDAWREFEERGEQLADRPGGHRAVRIIDLLDDEVDLTPARHIPHGGVAAGETPDIQGRLAELGAALQGALSLTGELQPLASPSAAAPAAGGPVVTVGDLLRGGHLTLHTGTAAHQPLIREGEAPPGAVPVLSAADVLAGAAPSGWLPAAEVDPAWPATRPGDVVVAVAPHLAATRVAGPGVVVLGPQVHALRPDPAALDPWFLAGSLRSRANVRQAGTHASTTSRVDLRRMQLLRLPPAEQRRYGAAFQRLDSFERALTAAAAVGTDLVHSLTDALAAGALPPDAEG